MVGGRFCIISVAALAKKEHWVGAYEQNRDESILDVGTARCDMLACAYLAARLFMSSVGKYGVSDLFLLAWRAYFTFFSNFWRPDYAP
jgi:hypothetical protein